MRLYWEVARRGYRRYAAYPAATWAGLFTNVVFGFMRGSVLLALFRQRHQIGGYDAADAMSYTWLTQALLMTVYLWGWKELALRIRSGDIAVDLSRPLDVQLGGLAFDLGRACYHALFRGIPPLLVGVLVFDLTVPSRPLVWLAFLASVALAVAVSYAFRFGYNLPAFWLADYRGVASLATLTATLLSGFVVPVALFPEWLAAVAHATPFPAMAQTPIDVFVGAVRGPAVLTALAAQAGWLVALLLLGRALFAAGTRRLVVQGG
ncbi:MAG: ABC transporter permease [Egibacteraceae bacterium]